MNFLKFDMIFEKMVKFYTKAMLNFGLIEEIPTELYPDVRLIFFEKKSAFRTPETSFFKRNTNPGVLNSASTNGKKVDQPQLL